MRWTDYLRIAAIWFGVALFVGAVIAELDGRHGSIIWVICSPFASAAAAIVHIAWRLIRSRVKSISGV